MCMHAWLIDDRRIDACLGELHFLMNIILSWMVKFSSRIQGNAVLTVD
jgi:hypothetical protein